MTDDTQKNLIQRHDKRLDEHDNTIRTLVASVEQLVETQAVTNQRLEEISRFLSKQAVFSTRLDDLDRNLSESFKRVHERIDKLENTQDSEVGCNSVRLLNRDLTHLTEDIDRLVNSVSTMAGKVDTLEEHQRSFLSPSTIKWIAGFIIVYIIGFGSYTAGSINSINSTMTKHTVLLDTNSKELTRFEHWLGFMQHDKK